MPYEEEADHLKTEALDIQKAIVTFKAHLQSQHFKEFDARVTSQSRGIIYANAGTACQNIMHNLTHIIDDLELLEDLPAKELTDEEAVAIQIF